MPELTLLVGKYISNPLHAVKINYEKKNTLRCVQSLINTPENNQPALKSTPYKRRLTLNLLFYLNATFFNWN